MKPEELRAAYQRGENISLLLRRELSSAANSEEIIELVYDIQAGSYVEAMANPEYADFKAQSGKSLSDYLQKYGAPKTVLEAGVGEATTLSSLLRFYKVPDILVHGFDLSWSRIFCGKNWLAGQGFKNVSLCTGSLSDIPYEDNSFDTVYTAHSIEPNGGHEARIISELCRVASRYVLLIEPCYELASPEGKARIDKLGYCKNLRLRAEALGMKVVLHEPYPNTANPLNPTAITVIEKNPHTPHAQPIYQCPRFKKSLTTGETFCFGSDTLAVYPVLAGIPCLRKENAIIAGLYSGLVLPKERSAENRVML
jgi:SAM-dependent methyltransferase